jgi:7-cyano-7-deazaguanine synthase
VSIAEPVSGALTLLLLSGGLDSAAVAAWQRPDRTLFIDYGHRASAAEARAAAAVAAELGLDHARTVVDASAVGGGLLSRSSAESVHRSPEWWPFRNQLLLTVAASWLIREYPQRALASANDPPWTILFGTVASDGKRHLDGSPPFFSAADQLLRTQEGGLRCSAPAIGLSTEELIRMSGAADDVLGWTHSCHVLDRPCGDCPGCWKRQNVLDALGRLG